MSDQAISIKTTTRLIGALILLSTTSSIIGFSLVGSMIEGTDYLGRLYPDKMKLSLGILFHLVNDACIVAVGILMFGLFKKLNHTIATAIMGTRLLEGGILAIGKISLLLLMTISKEFIAAGMPEGSHFQILGKLAIKWQAWSFELAMIALGLGGIALSWLLFSKKLVPRWMAVLGIIGYISLFSRSVLNILGYPQGFAMFAPGALFEFIFPVWIIVKGINWSGKSLPE